MRQETVTLREQGGATRYWLGVYYPAGYTIAVIDDIDEAKSCVNDLVGLGIPASDVELITSAEALEIHRRQRRERSWLDRILGAFPTDEHSVQDEYLANAAEGSHFVGFRSHTREQETRGRQALAAHHARLVRHYGRWTWEDAS
jgi:hypothetical protein